MTFQKTTSHTARIEHPCQSCARTIEPGEVYGKTIALDSGSTGVYKECGHCSALADLWDLFQWTNREGYGREEFQEYGRDVARDTMRDARWYVQWTRQWRRRDGTLYPIPSRASEEAA